MYILLMTLQKLFLLVCLYVFAIFAWWDFLGLWTMFWGLIPGVFLVYTFGYPLWVYSSFALCTLISLSLKGVALEPLLYNQLFWGVQIAILSALISVSLYKASIFPKSIYKKEDCLKKNNFSADEMVMILNPFLHIIEKVSPSIQKIYGWTKNDLEGRTVQMIYPKNIFEHPPEDFWDSLHKYHYWSGSVEVWGKDKLLCEEIALYKAIVNAKNEIVLIEKKILEIFVKSVEVNDSHWYKQFYDDSPLPHAIINNKHQIEVVNPSFTKMSAMKTFPKHKLFSELFPNEYKEQWNVVINESLSGESIWCRSVWETIDGSEIKVYQLIPFTCPKLKKITHVLLTILPNYVAPQIRNLIARDKQPPFQSYTTKKMLVPIIHTAIGEWNILHPHTTLKLSMNSIANIPVFAMKWYSFLMEVFDFVDQSSLGEVKKIALSCDINNLHYCFKIAFTGIMYADRDNLTENMKKVLEALQPITHYYSFEEGKHGNLVMVVKFAYNYNLLPSKVKRKVN